MTTQLRVLWAEQSFSFYSLMRSLVSCSSSIPFLFTIIVSVSVNFMGTCKLIVITRAFQVTNLFIPLNDKDLSNYCYIHYTHTKPVLHIKGSTTNKIKPYKAPYQIFLKHRHKTSPIFANIFQDQYQESPLAQPHLHLIRQQVGEGLLTAANQPTDSDTQYSHPNINRMATFKCARQTADLVV